MASLKSVHYYQIVMVTFRRMRMNHTQKSPNKFGFSFIFS